MDITKLFTVNHQSTKASIGLLILRTVAGIALMMHGYPKMQNPTEWLGPDTPFHGALLFLAALSEFGGGLGLLLGLLTPVALFGIICTMVVATSFHVFILHSPFVSKSPGGLSFESASASGYLAIAMMFLLVGPGKFFLDHKLFNSNPKS